MISLKKIIYKWFLSSSRLKNQLALLALKIYSIPFIKFSEISLAQRKLVDSGIKKTSIWIWLDLFFNYLFLGQYPSDYITYSFQSLSLKQRLTFFSSLESSLFSSSINNLFQSTVLSNKNSTYNFFKTYFGREQIKIGRQEDYNSFIEFIKKHPSFFCKPIEGSCGFSSNIIDTNGRDPKQVFDEIISNGVFVVEELIIQSQEMASLNPSSVNTVRTTMIKTNNGIELLFGFVRSGRKGSVVDNGGAGGIIIPYNPENGKLSKFGFDESGHTYTEHPDSHIVFNGFSIPHWKEICELSLKITQMIPEFNYVGWDIAVTNNDIVIVEGNSQPMFVGLQGLHTTGFRNEIYEIVHTGNIPNTFREKQKELFK